MRAYLKGKSAFFLSLPQRRKNCVKLCIDF